METGSAASTATITTDYLAEVAELFRGHEVLRDYAAALGARIVNRTRGSMIDAYERNPE